MTSTDLDPDYLVTHDDPHHANVELAARRAAERALIGRVVSLGPLREIGVVVKVFAPEVVNVVMLHSLQPMISVQGFALVTSPRVVCPVFWRHESGIQYVALVTGIHDDGHDLLVLGDGFFDLGAGPGVPIAVGSVVKGAGHLNWQTELDP